MPDRRRHRGPHQRDAQLFAHGQRATLVTATAELSWLLDHGYAPDAALKLVGDHHQLQRRQRRAVLRGACGRKAATARKTSTLTWKDRDVVVDGFNLLITVEAALAGGVLLRGVDGRHRDLSSVHGSYRRVEESARALDLLVEALAHGRTVHWVLDRPVSNSGRVAAAVRARGLTAEVHDRADGRLLHLATEGALLASADGPLLDRALQEGAGLCDPMPEVLASIDAPWVVDLCQADDEE